MKVDQLYGDGCNDKDFMKFICKYPLGETGLCREIKICFVAREHTWYIIS